MLSVCTGRGIKKSSTPVVVGQMTDSYLFRITVIAWITSLMVAMIVNANNTILIRALLGICLGLLRGFAIQVSLGANSPMYLYPYMCLTSDSITISLGKVTINHKQIKPEKPNYFKLIHYPTF